MVYILVEVSFYISYMYLTFTFTVTRPFNRYNNILPNDLRQDFLATRNMTRIDVGLAQSYVKLLLSSWKTYMCNLMAWYINK